MARLTLISLVLLGGAVSGFAPRSTIRATRRTTLASAEVDEEETISAEEIEIRREAAMIAKKKRSNMYNENGVAYAPWMVNQVDEEAYNTAKELRKMRKKQEKASAVTSEGAYFSTDLQGDELSGAGLSFKILGDEVELSWSTQSEPDNLGYQVQKRAARSEQWFTVATYEDWAPLVSKGSNGGSYSIIDPESETGDWIYRVVDCDRAGRNTVLCQALVEVQTPGEKALQYVLAGGFVAVFGGFMAAGSLLDPIQ